jgi:ABC-type multidrug transport system permease subunit
MPLQFSMALRLHFRNKLALIYSYLFPTLFLLAFWVLYRHDQVPLARHVGELLTVTALGGACFGLPTSLVSERERGVWRRYRLAPVHTGQIVASTLVARYVLLLLAAVLQLALAMALGMPLPQHPLQLWMAFTAVTIAFLGLGMVIAMLANTVPAVQALGQCLFLPMLIIGGVAVPLASLPPWAQRVASYFPGRYAVDAIQSTVTGTGLSAARFSIAALLVIGVAGCVAGARMFRWDAHHRLATSAYGWVAVALSAWFAVGLAAETRGLGTPRPRSASAKASAFANATADKPADEPASANEPASAKATADRPADKTADAPEPRTPNTERRTSEPRIPTAERRTSEPRTPTAERRTSEPRTPTGEPPPAPNAERRPPTVEAGWRSVTRDLIDRDLRFDRLPSDEGVVAPVARADDTAETDVDNHLEFLRTQLLVWKPAQVADPLQRVRNVLFVAAVPDVFQIDPLERFIPLVVFDHLQQNIPSEDLVKILYWIALHPNEGDDSAVDELKELRLGAGPRDIEQARQRAALYAVKLLGRITGKIANK